MTGEDIKERSVSGEVNRRKSLIESGSIQLGNVRYKTEVFQTTKSTDQVSYSFEVIFDNYDKIILDDDDLPSLKAKVDHIVPVAYYSRILIAKMAAK